MSNTNLPVPQFLSDKFGLSSAEAQLARALIETGGNVGEAAALVGMDPAIATNSTYSVEFLRTCNFLLQVQLISRLAPKATKRLDAELDRPKADRAAIAAALGVLDRAMNAQEKSGAVKDLADMSLAELHAFIREREAKLPVVAPSAPVIEPDLPDSLR